MFLSEFNGNTFTGDFMSTQLYGKIFARRTTLCFLVAMLLMLSCVLRIIEISTADYKEIQASQMLYRVNITKLRGTIYDCNMVPLTNTTSGLVAAISPTSKGMTAISSALEGEERKKTIETLSLDKPVVCAVDKEIMGESVSTTRVYEHTPTSSTACHIIGYTDAEGHGVSGLELAYDDILYSDKTVSAVFASDGKGNILKGIEPYFENDLSVVHSGVVTTLDINIQNITENALKNLTSGCAIVSEVKTGKIRAIASVPTFDINNLSLSLQSENSPLLNRALLAYNVGSVFKPCVAAVAIESGCGSLSFNCEGKIKIVDREFSCHKLQGHGNVDLQTALSESCNCFFYNLALNLGGDPIYKMASTLGFGTETKIAKNISTDSGILPKTKTLANQGALANLSIGQGELILSPVSMLALYQAIAGDGGYYLPSIVEKTIKNDLEEIYDAGHKTRVMSAETAGILRGYLRSVVTDGTGKEAQPKLCDAAGKTATAQTGRYYESGVEITNSWFCGFFPFENPKYVVVVMSDSKLQVSTASIFSQIADGITQFKNLNMQNNG